MTIMELFEQESFQKAAKDICPKDKQYLDPFQFNVIMQIPGTRARAHTRTHTCAHAHTHTRTL